MVHIPMWSILTPARWRRRIVSAVTLLAMLTGITYANDTRPRHAVARDKTSPPPGFTMPLRIANGHIPEVHIGTRSDATDGFDAGIDDMAPPPGIGGGYTFLISPDRRYNLYRDIRPVTGTVQWLFYARTGSKPVSLSWDSTAIPADRDLYCGRWDGKSDTMTDIIDCRSVHRVETKKLCFFRFWMVPRATEAAPQPDDSMSKRPNTDHPTTP